MAKDIYKTIEIEGEVYSLCKFDAMTGLQIARLLLAKGAPLVAALSKEENNPYEALGILLSAFTDDELESLVRKCLRCCYKMMPAGPQQIMDERGYYGMEGIEYDAPLITKLCVEAVKWGATDFFGERALGLFRQLA